MSLSTQVTELLEEHDAAFTAEQIAHILDEPLPHVQAVLEALQENGDIIVEPGTTVLRCVIDGAEYYPVNRETMQEMVWNHAKDFYPKAQRISTTSLRNYIEREFDDCCYEVTLDEQYRVE